MWIPTIGIHCHNRSFPFGHYQSCLQDQFHKVLLHLIFIQFSSCLQVSTKFGKELVFDGDQTPSSLTMTSDLLLS